ncbi:MAG TPA: patatin-like phospholipase family protein [Pseudolabrys sp.]|nr:patatin-like phospholipase family protein [Pseudolabrys sp.]
MCARMLEKYLQLSAAFHGLRAGIRIIASLLVAVIISSCATLERLPAVTYAEARQVDILDIPDARFYVSDTDRIYNVALKAFQRSSRARPAHTRNFLALSGGGDDGAFGAGVLVGWSAHGDRPVFDMVTGVSTGALSAPFAFLGSAYDQKLAAVYTETSAGDIFEKRAPLLAAVTSDSLVDNAPLRRLIEHYVDTAMIQKIAEEYRKGRLLFVLTTNLDQSRPVIWNVGAIAASNSPQARDLIVNVLLASASIPAVFPPVMLDVTIGGEKRQEMHVDGGTVAQVFFYPPSFSVRRAAARLGVEDQKLLARKRVAYVIRNGRFFRADESVQPRTLAIAKEALSTMTMSSGVNDTYRMYLLARRDGIDFNLASIGEDFKLPYQGPFDPNYMQPLFAYGYEKGRNGYPWQKVPPGYTN